MFKLLTRAMALLVLATGPAAAQSAEDFLSRYTGPNAQGYLGPLADYLGASLNSGWARSARVDPGFSIRLSFVAAGAPISDSRRTFTGVTDGSFSPQATREVPTIFGDAEPVIVDGQGGTAYVFPGGLDADLMATVVPQLSIGSIKGTMFSARWLGYDLDDDLGDISLIGFGARHDLGQYFTGLPVDLAVGAYWQSFELGDALETSAFLVSAHASRRMGMLTLFGGLGYESSSSDISFVREGETAQTTISLDADNSVRLSAGLSLRLAFLEIFGDYTLASQNAFTIGFGIGR